MRTKTIIRKNSVEVEDISPRSSEYVVSARAKPDMRDEYNPKRDDDMHPPLHHHNHNHSAYDAQTNHIINNEEHHYSPPSGTNNIYHDDNNNIYIEEEIPFEEKTPHRGFFLSSLSIDETRLSVLIICLLACMIFGGVNYVLLGDITTNLMQIILTLIYAIAGVNITNAIVNTFNPNGGKSSEMIVNAKSATESVRKKFRKLTGN